MAAVVQAERSPHWSPSRNATARPCFSGRSSGLQPHERREQHSKASRPHVSFVHVSAGPLATEACTSESERDGEEEGEEEGGEEGGGNPLPGKMFAGQRITAMGRAGPSSIPAFTGAQLPSNNDLPHRRHFKLAKEPSFMWMEQETHSSPGAAPGTSAFKQPQSSLALPTSLSCQPRGTVASHTPPEHLRLLKPSSSPCLTHGSVLDASGRPAHNNANASGTPSSSSLASSTWMGSVSSGFDCTEDDFLEDWDPESILSEGQEFREGCEGTPLGASLSRDKCPRNDANQGFSFSAPGHEHTGLQVGQRGRNEEELRRLERESENVLMVALEHKLKLIDAQRERSAAHCAKFLLDLERESQVQKRKQFWGRRTVSAAHTLERRERRAALSRRTVTEKCKNLNVS